MSQWGRFSLTQKSPTPKKCRALTLFTISEFIDLLTNYFTAKKSFAKSNSDESNLTVSSKRNSWVAVLNELARYNVPTSLTSLGKLQFEYLGNKDIIGAAVEKYGIKDAKKGVLIGFFSLLVLTLLTQIDILFIPNNEDNCRGGIDLPVELSF